MNDAIRDQAIRQRRDAIERAERAEALLRRLVAHHNGDFDHHPNDRCWKDAYAALRGDPA